MNDRELLQAFARQKSEAAFAELVRRHGKLVYSCARQRVGDPHAAEDITQSVFLALAIKAPTLPAGTILTGWLYRATQFAAVKYHRREHHRQEREMRASEHQQIHGIADDTAALWEQISPHLAEALDGLSATDREAVLLRFYEQANYPQIAETLSLSHDAARKRVDRALEQLRRFFTRKGVGIGTGALVSVLGARAAEAIPLSLAAQTVQTAVAGVTGTMAATETLMLAKGALHAMFIAKVKAVSLAAAACLVVASTGMVVAQQITRPQPPEPRTSTVVVGPSSTTTEVATVTVSAQSPTVPANIPSLVAGQKVLASFRHYPVAEHRDGPNGRKTVPITDADIIEGKKRKHAEVLAALRAAGLDVLQVVSVVQGGLNEGGLVYESLILLDGKGQETEQALASVPYFFAGIVFQDGNYQKGLPMPKNQLPNGWDKQPPVPAAYAYKHWGVANWQERELDLQRYKTLPVVKVEYFPVAAGGAGGGGSAGCVLLKPTPGHTLLEVFLVTGAGFQTCSN